MVPHEVKLDVDMFAFALHIIVLDDSGGTSYVWLTPTTAPPISPEVL